MRQIFIIEANIPHDQYGIDADSLQDTLEQSHNSDVRFKVIPIEERVDIARIENLLKN